MLPGGWLRTGDIGRFSGDGALRLVDRKRDMVWVSGLPVA
jgi:long-chain acyl-CoA synthetase